MGAALKREKLVDDGDEVLTEKEVERLTVLPPGKIRSRFIDCGIIFTLNETRDAFNVLQPFGIQKNEKVLHATFRERLATMTDGEMAIFETALRGVNGPIERAQDRTLVENPVMAKLRGPLRDKVAGIFETGTVGKRPIAFEQLVQCIERFIQKYTPTT